MATFYSNIYPNRLSPVVALHQRALGPRLTPRTDFAIIEYTFLGTEVANDVVRLWKFPAGTIILPHLCRTQIPTDIATTLTLDYGDQDIAGVGLAADPDRYAAAIDGGAPGGIAWTGGVALNNWYQLKEDAWVTMTFKTLTGPLVGTIRSGIMFNGA